MDYVSLTLMTNVFGYFCQQWMTFFFLAIAYYLNDIRLKMYIDDSFENQATAWRVYRNLGCKKILFCITAFLMITASTFLSPLLQYVIGDEIIQVPAGEESIWPISRSDIYLVSPLTQTKDTRTGDEDLQTLLNQISGRTAIYPTYEMVDFVERDEYCKNRSSYEIHFTASAADAFDTDNSKNQTISFGVDGLGKVKNNNGTFDERLTFTSELAYLDRSAKNFTIAQEVREVQFLACDRSYRSLFLNFTTVSGEKIPGIVNGTISDRISIELFEFKPGTEFLVNQFNNTIVSQICLPGRCVTYYITISDLQAIDENGNLLKHYYRGAVGDNYIDSWNGQPSNNVFLNRAFYQNFNFYLEDSAYMHYDEAKNYTLLVNSVKSISLFSTDDVPNFIPSTRRAASILKSSYVRDKIYYLPYREVVSVTVYPVSSKHIILVLVVCLAYALPVAIMNLTGTTPYIFWQIGTIMSALLSKDKNSLKSMDGIKLTTLNENKIEYQAVKKDYDDSI